MDRSVTRVSRIPDRRNDDFVSGSPSSRLGLTEIPRDCALALAVKWAFAKAPSIRNYKQARAAVDRKFKGMSGVHTINNACLTIFGVAIGGTDFTSLHRTL